MVNLHIEFSNNVRFVKIYIIKLNNIWLIDVLFILFMIKMIIDLLQIIVDYSSVNNQIICTSINNDTYHNLLIYKLDIPDYSLIDYNIIIQHRFRNMKIFGCCRQNNISDVNHWSDTLKELYCSGRDCAIDQNGISQLKVLKVLNCNDNMKIYDLNHLTDSLEELYCSRTGYSACPIKPDDKIVNQIGISKLANLKILDCSNNEYINNINHLSKTLKKLYCQWDSKIILSMGQWCRSIWYIEANKY